MEIKTHSYRPTECAVVVWANCASFNYSDHHTVYTSGMIVAVVLITNYEMWKYLWERMEMRFEQFNGIENK